MVYCPKCGTKNEDAAVFCVSCGATLQTGTYTSRQMERKRAEDQCFGLPHGGAIAAIVIGGILLFWGFVLLAQQSGWITTTPDFGIVVLLTIGILMVAGAIYRMTRPKPAPT